MSESLFADASLRLEKALKHAEISPDASDRLKFPKASLRVSIPVRLDDGSLRVFQGYRVRYDDTRGPTKGGRGAGGQGGLDDGSIQHHPATADTSGGDW